MNEKPVDLTHDNMVISKETFQMMIHSQNLALMEYSKLTTELAEIRTLLYQRLAPKQQPQVTQPPRIATPALNNPPAAGGASGQALSERRG